MNPVVPVLAVMGLVAGFGLWSRQKKGKGTRKAKRRPKRGPHSRYKVAAVAAKPRETEADPRVHDTINEAIELRKKFARTAADQDAIAKALSDFDTGGDSAITVPDLNQLMEKAGTSKHVKPKSEEVVIYWTDTGGFQRHAFASKAMASRIEFKTHGFSGTGIDCIAVPSLDVEINVVKSKVRRGKNSNVFVNLIDLQDNRKDWLTWLDTMSRIGYVDSDVWETS